ncbi:MAG: hypothetical protein Q7P63_11885 [Verrucomicrobiota bacterium JB022]|nr:hypothetical protein [Verrucomicrobiota bacterium JB022]
MCFIACSEKPARMMSDDTIRLRFETYRPQLEALVRMMEADEEVLFVCRETFRERGDSLEHQMERVGNRRVESYRELLRKAEVDFITREADGRIYLRLDHRDDLYGYCSKGLVYTRQQVETTDRELQEEDFDEAAVQQGLYRPLVSFWYLYLAQI